MPSHFYGLPTPSALSLNQLRGVRDPNHSLEPSRSTSRKESRNGLMCLDSLALAGGEATSSADNVLLASSGNSLHVFKVDREKPTHLGCVEGLRGTVVAAKLLPCAEKEDKLRYLRPLIAVVVHGPSLSTRSLRDSAYSSDLQFDPSHQQKQPSPTTLQYQTSVEIYSLRSKAHIARLYRSPSVDVEPDLGRRPFEPPRPIGALTINAKGRFLTISSGDSGEVYIYDLKGSISRPIRCIGKIWTSIPQRKGRTWSSSSASSEAEGREKPPTRTPRPDAALMSLSNRWLAYVPPVSSSRSTIFGKVDLAETPRKPPGITSHTAPSQPQATCELDTPFEESMVNKVARDMTQEMLKGAKWVGDQGKQVWKSYWTKSPEITPYEQPRPLPQQFPPTHASNDQSRILQQPTVISILDLERLADNQDAKSETALQPIATFPLPRGCSFLSFNPTGLTLLTANLKGDVQYIWDLMQMLYPRSSQLLSTKPDVPPTVRQVARFTRVTVANIVDAVWLEPRGEKLAIITDRGTVHLHDLPQSALQWPPPTRIIRSAEIEQHQSETPSTQPASGGWNSAFSAVSGSFAAVRNNPLMGFGNFNLAQASAGAGARGGKMVVHGFSKSVEAATGFGNTLIHMGETRLHIPGFSSSLNLGCARWWTGKDVAIAVCGNGVIRLYRVDMRTQKNKNGKKKSHSVVGERLAEFGIPDLAKHRKHSDDELANNGIDVEITWPNIPHAARPQSSGNNSSINPLSFAEIDSCTPYQPFHVDRRVGLYAYSDSSYKPGPYDKWIFGEDIPTKLVQDKSNTDSDLVSLEEPALKQSKDAVPSRTTFAKSPKKARTSKANSLVKDSEPVPPAPKEEPLADFANSSQDEAAPPPPPPPPPDVSQMPEMDEFWGTPPSSKKKRGKTKKRWESPEAQPEPSVTAPGAIDIQNPKGQFWHADDLSEALAENQHPLPLPPDVADDPEDVFWAEFGNK